MTKVWKQGLCLQTLFHLRVFVSFSSAVLVSYYSGFVTSYNLYFFPRYQDENTQAFFMVVSSNQWLSVRLDLLSSVFITAVAVATILVSENPGQLVRASY